MMRAVQFPHPGPEPRVSPRAVEIGWNAGADHRRRFLYANGMFRTRPDGADKRGPLALWGEWEPEARIVHSWPESGELPTTAFEPFWRRKVSYAGLQNTDPFVFGGSFLYGNCRQYKNDKQKLPTRPGKLRDLARGSVVLFGSKAPRRDAFVLDTVLVVADSTLYDLRRPTAIAALAPPAYHDITIQPLANHPRVVANPAAFSNGLRLYRGATPASPENGLFSFAPCMANGTRQARFARPTIVLAPYVNSRNFRSEKTRSVTAQEAQVAWHAVVAQVLDAGLDLCTSVDLPAEERECRSSESE